jgi:hypothetical protein
LSIFGLCFLIVKRNKHLSLVQNYNYLLIPDLIAIAIVTNCQVDELYGKHLYWHMMPISFYSFYILKNKWWRGGFIIGAMYSSVDISDNQALNNFCQLQTTNQSKSKSKIAKTIFGLDVFGWLFYW